MSAGFEEICDRVAVNLKAVNQEISEACDAAERDRSAVKLVAVTKYAEWDWVRALSREHAVFGENRPQQLAERAVLDELSQPAEWHLIGQLQRNKARSAVQHASLIHSVDSLRLLQRLSSVAGDLNVEQRLLLQVNVTGEESKSGFSPDGLRLGIDEILQVPSVHLDGLMTMAPAGATDEETYACFSGLRDLRDEIRESSDAKEVGHSFSELSMGMSGDFPTAIRAGATIVRIGRRLYDGL